MKLQNIVFGGFCVSDLHEMRSCLESDIKISPVIKYEKEKSFCFIRFYQVKCPFQVNLELDFPAMFAPDGIQSVRHSQRLAFETWSTTRPLAGA